MKVYILEGDWKWNISLLPTMELFQKIEYFEIKYIRVSSQEGLYQKLSQCKDADVIYLSFHGRPGLVWAGKDRVMLQKIFRAIPDVGRKVVHFGTCLTLKKITQKTYRPFPRMVSGYSKSVGWFESLANDVMLLTLLAEGLPFGKIKKEMYSNRLLKKRTGFRMVYNDQFDHIEGTDKEILDIGQEV